MATLHIVKVPSTKRQSLLETGWPTKQLQQATNNQDPNLEYTNAKNPMPEMPNNLI